MTTANGMSESEIIDLLSRSNRAYNLLYALGESPVTVDTLTPVEVGRLIDKAQSAFAGMEGSFERLLRQKVSPTMLRYVATGKME